MKKLKHVIIILLLLLTGWVGTKLYQQYRLAQNPPKSWNVAFLSPSDLDAPVLYMIYYSEDGQMRKVNDFFSTNKNGGHIDNWGKYFSGGPSNMGRLPSLPRLISICWYSRIEQQTYATEFTIVPQTLELMKEKLFLNNNIHSEVYRDTLYVGLAPGGTVNMWLNSPDDITKPNIWVGEGKTKRAEETDWCRGKPEFSGLYDYMVEIKKKRKFPYGHWKLTEPNPLPYSNFFVVADENTGEPISLVKYRITTDDGRIYEGRTNQAGQTVEVFAESEAAIHIELFEDNPTEN